jgi:cephalosporin hydroxylase
MVILTALSIHYIPHKDYIYKYIFKGISYSQNPNYIENTRVILEKYKGVEPKSIVIFGSIHLRYLREDIIPTEIYGKFSLAEYINYFTQKKDWNVYINIRDDLNPETIHESFIRFMETNSDRQIVKVH